MTISLAASKEVQYSTALTAFRAKQLVDEIKQYPKIAWDFETSVKYSQQDIEHWKHRLETENLPKLERVQLESKIMATALDHPSHCKITHCSIAVSDCKAYVFIFENAAIQNFVLNFLLTSEQKQILHNASYDFRFLKYYGGGYPKDYEDTAVLAKCLVNHVEPHKARVGLKELAGHVYGSWALAADNFHYDNMKDEKLLKYAATDACATFWLWEYLNKECDALDNQLASYY